MQAGQADPFGTVALRARVLEAWAASPARFREDANAEEDYALGGYRDRVITELAQNAADAAARAGVPGRLRLTLAGGTLTAANTGAPLDAAGVAALSSLRASAKRGAAQPAGPGVGGDRGGPGGAGGLSRAGSVGRFGVGFAAAAAVSDEPRICSVTGTVAWSRRGAASLVGAVPELAGELAARSGHVPVLRLPFAGTGAPPDGFATEVILPLRDQAAVALVRELLARASPALLLALPALADIEISAGGTRRVLTAAWHARSVAITDGGTSGHWRIATAAGEAAPALLADRPAEERARPAWSVTWAVPVTEDGAPAGTLPASVPAVVHAPTPSDEPLSLPALLLASFPLSPDRRHVAPGPLTGFLVEQAGAVYARLLSDLPPGPALLDLVPGPVGAGELDARLRGAILARLPETPFLPGAAGPVAAGEQPPDGGGVPRLRPRDAVVLETMAPALVGYLAPVLAGLVAGPARHPAYAALGLRRLRLADLTDALAGLDRDPGWWRGLYAALSDVDAGQLGELGALPVPLADGRRVRGPRGLLLPGPGTAGAGEVSVLGLRVVHRDAVHPLLARLGATEASPRGILTDPAVRAAVAASADEDDPGPVADAVLGLVAAARLHPGELAWLADLVLLGADGDWYPADELLLPGGPLAGVVAADAPFGTADPGLVARYGASVLEAVGVLSSFGLLTAADVSLDNADLDLDGIDDWAADVTSGLPAGPVPPVAAEVVAVRDLELVDPGRWPQALALLAVPPLRAALTEPVRVQLPDGRSAGVAPYTAWWLRHAPVLGGRRPGELRAAGSDPLLAGLYDEVPVPVDPELARVLGIRTSAAALLAEPGGPDELLDRLADPGRLVSRGQLTALWAALAAARAPAGDGAGGPDEQAGRSGDDAGRGGRWGGPGGPGGSGGTGGSGGSGDYGGEPAPPDRVRAVRGTEVVVADAAEVLILDAPDLWPLAAAQPLVLAPGDQAGRLADMLDIPLASEEITGRVESPWQRQPVPDIVRVILPDAPRAYCAHTELIVDGVTVPWRYAGGDVHAAGPDGLAHALAWSCGRWAARHVLAALLKNPGAAARLLAEADLDPR